MIPPNNNQKDKKMLTKTRSDFWKCGKCGELLVRENEPHACYFDEELRHALDYRPTPAQVLAAWLQADDDRRREIEIASVPDVTQHGKYVAWRIGKDGEPTIVPSHYRVGPNHVENPKEWLADYRYFWEPLSE